MISLLREFILQMLNGLYSQSLLGLHTALVGIGLLLLLPFFYIALRGQDVKRHAKHQGQRRSLRLLRLMIHALIIPTIFSGLALSKTWVIVQGRIDPLRAGLTVAAALCLGLAVTFALQALLYPGGIVADTLNLLLSPLRGTVRRRYDEMGSAHFCDPLEYRRFAKKTVDGIALLGEFRGEEYRPHHYRVLGNTFSLDSEDAARGIITIGNPGSGKSAGVMLPIIADSMKDGKCLVVVDPQGELKHEISKYAKITGHYVVIHDPTDTETPRYNLASDVEDVSYARTIAAVLLPAKDGDYWTSSAQALIASCLVRYGCIGEIVEKLGKTEELIADLSSIEDDAYYLVSDFVNAARSAPKQAQGTAGTAKTALVAWSDSKVRDSTNASDFTAAVLVRSKTPVVIVLSCPGKQRKALAPYLGAVVTRIVLDLDAIGEKLEGGALPRATSIMVDEFPAMGDLSFIVEQANLVRKRRISFVLAAQTVGQLTKIYGHDGAATLLAGMATQIIFGGCDKETAAYFADIAGNQTRKVEKDGRVVERPLLSKDQIIAPPHAPQGNVIIFSRYNTDAYAVNAVILARLTRIYQRKDWLEAIRTTKNMPSRVVTREMCIARGEKRKRKAETAEEPAAISANGHANQNPEAEKTIPLIMPLYERGTQRS